MTLAVQIRQHGGPEELQIVDVQVGEPGPGEVRIRHRAVGLNSSTCTTAPACTP